MKTNKSKINHKTQFATHRNKQKRQLIQENPEEDYKDDDDDATHLEAIQADYRGCIYEFGTSSIV